MTGHTVVVFQAGAPPSSEYLPPARRTPLRPVAVVVLPS